MSAGQQACFHQHTESACAVDNNRASVTAWGVVLTGDGVQCTWFTDGRLLLHSLANSAACCSGACCGDIPTGNSTQASQTVITKMLMLCMSHHGIDMTVAARNHKRVISNAEIHTAVDEKMVSGTGSTCVNFCSSRAIRPFISARGLGLRKAVLARLALPRLHPETIAFQLLPQQLGLEPEALYLKAVPLRCDVKDLRLYGHASGLFSQEILHNSESESAVQNTQWQRPLQGISSRAIPCANLGKSSNRLESVTQKV